MFLVAYGETGIYVTGDGTLYPIVYGDPMTGKIIANIGNCYNTSTGEFTVPSTGIYMFQAQTYYILGSTTVGSIFTRTYNVTGGSDFMYHCLFTPQVAGSLILPGIGYDVNAVLNAGDVLHNVVAVNEGVGGPLDVKLGGWGSGALNTWWACYKVT